MKQTTKMVRLSLDIVERVERNKKKTGVPVKVFIEQATDEKLIKQSKKK